MHTYTLQIGTKTENVTGTVNRTLPYLGTLRLSVHPFKEKASFHVEGAVEIDPQVDHGPYPTFVEVRPSLQVITAYNDWQAAFTAVVDDNWYPRQQELYAAFERVNRGTVVLRDFLGQPLVTVNVTVSGTGAGPGLLQFDKVQLDQLPPVDKLPTIKPGQGAKIGRRRWW